MHSSKEHVLALIIPTTEADEFRRVRIAQCRLTQAELAEALGMSQQTISRYERGGLEIPITVGLALEAIQKRGRGPVRAQMQWDIPHRRANWRELRHRNQERLYNVVRILTREATPENLATATQLAHKDLARKGAKHIRPMTKEEREEQGWPPHAGTPQKEPDGQFYLYRGYTGLRRLQDVHDER